MLASCSVIEGILGTDSSNEGGTDLDDGYKYIDFTDEEKKILTESVGSVIPFIPCHKYYFEGIYNKADFGDGVKYYTTGSTRADFDNYVKLYADYEFVGTYVDNFGDTWYTYKNDGITVNISYYLYSGVSYIDVLVYPTADSDGENTDGGNADSGNTDNGNTDSGNTDNGNTGGNTGDNTDNGNTGENTGDNTDNGNTGGNTGDNTDNGNTGGNTGDNTGGNGNDNTNVDNGYRAIDFTRATNVKNVTDQGYYLGGCPTTGSPSVLVIPVEFSDATAQSKGYSIDTIKKAWYGDSQSLDYYSVDEYYYISSYGQLDLDVTVLDFWFRPEKTSSYYESATTEYYGQDTAIGDQIVMDEALKYLDEVKGMDLSSFDSDNNGMIDAVVLITTLDVGEDDFHWAYRYWNIYTDEQEYYYEYDGVSANDYLWASYQFMHESYDQSGDVSYFDTSVTNTYTYIHEFGHVLGADDYYDTVGDNSPMGGYDVMDYMMGDHNAYTKFNYGWLTESRLVTATTSVTLTLEAFEKNGDTIIIANNWNDALGAYQEYYVVVYYTNSGLNSGDFGYFDRDGIVVYHINAALVSETNDGETYYDVKNNNSSPSASDDYGTADNLIEFVTHSGGTYTYVVGDTLPSVKDDYNRTIGYTFTVDSLNEDSATITFTKK